MNEFVSSVAKLVAAHFVIQAITKVLQQKAKAPPVTK